MILQLIKYKRIRDWLNYISNMLEIKKHYMINPKLGNASMVCSFDGFPDKEYEEIMENYKKDGWVE